MAALPGCGGDSNPADVPTTPIVDGQAPNSLVQGSDGNFYGTTSSGGYFGNGTVFRLTPAGSETVLYQFAGGASDGAEPNPGLIQGTDGNFYGTTSDGGVQNCVRLEPAFGGNDNGCGTVFKITPAGTETVLHFFANGADGGMPLAGLVEGDDGNFYGMTSGGGLLGGGQGGGTVYRITPDGTETVIYSFGASGDGSSPSGKLILGTDGNFYGTTELGGQTDSGTVFRISPAGAEVVLYSFQGGADGELPYGLVQGSDGALYGALLDTGIPIQTLCNGGCGTIFRVALDGTKSTFYKFGPLTAGIEPSQMLTVGSDGAIYGTASGGSANNGVIYVMTPASTETVLCAFAAGASSDSGLAALIRTSNGTFYGVGSGGAHSHGTVYAMSSDCEQTILWSFGG